MEPNSKQNIFAIPIAIVLAGIIVAGSIFESSKTDTTSTVANDRRPQTTNPQKIDISMVKTEGKPFVGNPNAPVTIAYWFDYQCPFCKQFEEQTMPLVVTDYVKTGKVKVVFKDFQFLGPDSQSAGLVEQAVWEIAPEKFYEWHKAIYDKQDKENAGWGNKADILALTKNLGIDSVKIEERIKTKAAEYQKAMDADKTEGGTFGVNGTPGFIIATQLISGAVPYSVIKQAIETALASK